jgi:group I intron endonuclease
MSNCGIYQIIDVETGKFYIGSTQNFKTRKSKHFSLLKRNIHDNRMLQGIYNKGRELSFKIYIICQKDDLFELEQKCINILKPQLNLAYCVEAPFKDRKHSFETLEKMKIKALRGDENPTKRPEVRKKMSENNRMRLPGSRETISGENHGMSKLTKIKVDEIKTLISEGNFTQTKIAEIYGVSIAQISRIKTGKRWNLENYNES